MGLFFTSEKTPLLLDTDESNDAERRTAARAETKRSVESCSQRDYASRNYSRRGMIIGGIVWVLVLEAAAALTWYLAFTSGETTAKEELCTSPACVHAASEILYSLSPKYKELDACDDFEELVCGGWRDRHDLRPDQGSVFTGTIMQEASEQLLRHILEDSYPETSDHSSFSPLQLKMEEKSSDEQNFEKIQSAYQACMNEDQIKKSGAEPLLKILEDIKDLSDKGDSNIRESVLYLAKVGIAGLVSVDTSADDKDPDAVVVVVDAPGSIGLPAKQYYEDEKVVAQYTEVVSKAMTGLSTAILSETATSIVDFEKKLAALVPDEEDRNDVTVSQNFIDWQASRPADHYQKYYNPKSLADTDALVPELELAAIIKALAPKDVSFDKIIVMAPGYLTNLSSMLNSVPSEVLQGYFLWKAAQRLSPYVDTPALQPYKDFVNGLRGRASEPERWRTCVQHVDGTLGWILSRFFVEKAFSAKAKELGDRLVSDIKEQFIQKLKKTNWMEKEVVEAAIRKVHNIFQKIGYPTSSPNITNSGELHTYYKDVEINSSTYFSNALSSNRFEVRREWSALGKPVDRAEWGMTVPTVNAYYNPAGNEIVFPAGIMQFPVFDVNVPGYLNYGPFASVAGHELSHAFDSSGRHYDERGNFTDWWTEKTVKAFEKRAECFVDQYSKYYVERDNGTRLSVNGRLTLGENIADAGGVAAAFAAWKQQSKKTPDKNLPGLEHFTQEQLFFVSYANWWCGETRREEAVQRIYTDPHAPKFARVLGTMANSRDFRESFKCKVKDPTCELW